MLKIEIKHHFFISTCIIKFSYKFSLLRKVNETFLSDKEKKRDRRLVDNLLHLRYIVPIHGLARDGLLQLTE